jgi:hypothetical protein
VLLDISRGMQVELEFGAQMGYYVRVFFFGFDSIFLQGITSRVCRSAILIIKSWIRFFHFILTKSMGGDYLDTLLRVCRKCGVRVLDESEPERIKNCVGCRAENRAKVGVRRSSLNLGHGNGPGKQMRKGGKGIKKLEGKAKVAGRKMVLEGEKKEREKKRRGLGVFKSSGELCEELRSEALDAFDGRYLLEFEGSFESVCVLGGVKEQVRKVTEELVGVNLLHHK